MINIYIYIYISGGEREGKVRENECLFSGSAYDSSGQLQSCKVWLHMWQTKDLSLSLTLSRRTLKWLPRLAVDQHDLSQKLQELSVRLCERTSIKSVGDRLLKSVWDRGQLFLSKCRFQDEVFDSPWSKCFTAFTDHFSKMINFRQLLSVSKIYSKWLRLFLITSLEHFSSLCLGYLPPCNSL